jgi:uncharacterized delta-60 repeat protein
VISAPASVNQIVPLPGGQALMIGDFTTVNGAAAPQIARLNADGSLDGSFAMAPEIQVSRIYAAAVQADGRILVGGQLTHYGADASRNYLFRLNANGSWDTTFNAGGFVYSPPASYGLNDAVRAIAVLPDGKILVGGDFTQPRNRIARLNADGSADATFDPGTGADGTVTHIVRQASGHVIVGGAFTTMNGVAKAGIARLAATGTLDAAAFGSGVYGGSVLAVAVQPDDRVLIGGNFSLVNGAGASLMARLSADGILDATYNPAARTYLQAVTSLLALPDKVLVGGWYSFIIFNGKPTDHNARIYVQNATDGAFVNTIAFAGKPTDLWTLATRSDGKVLAGGSFTQRDDPGDQSLFAGIALLSGDYLQPESTFKPVIGAQSDVLALAAQADGKVLAGGSFYLANGAPQNGIARFNADGTLDTTLATPATGGVVTGVLVRDDGKLVMGGSFYSIAGQDYKDVALLSATGTLEAGAYLGGVNALAWYPGNKVAAALAHTPGVRRLNADMSIDAAFTPFEVVTNYQRPDLEFDRANAVAVQADGKILVGGSFTNFSPAPVFQNIVRLNADGTLDTTFVSPAFTVYNFRSVVFAIAVQPDGKILIAGRFSTVGGVPSPTVARLNADGSVDTTFVSPFLNQGSTAHVLRLQSDGKILVGGNMQIIEGAKIYNSLVRLNPGGSRDATFDTSVTGIVKSLAIVPDAGTAAGRIVAGGTVSGVGTLSRPGMVRYGFTLADQSGVVAGALVTSSPVTIAGIDEPAAISVSGGSYAIDGSNTFVTAPGTIANGQTVWVRHTASATAGATANTVLTIGGFSDTFTSTTAMPSTGRLGNISTRGPVFTGNDVMIGGFIIGGSTPKKVLITARGPSLAAFGVTGAMANPRIELFSGQSKLLDNDDWQNQSAAAGGASAVNEITATGILPNGLAPSSPLESALMVSLNPGAYTAIVSGVGGGTGVAIVEVFEQGNLDIPLVNISTRGQVQTGDNVMIGGFIIQGSSPRTVLITARGPSLAPYGILNPLANPKLELFLGQTPIASNDDWETLSNKADVIATGVAPTDPREAALLVTLNPGAYTAIVSGVGGVTGVGIVEVFAR